MIIHDKKPCNRFPLNDNGQEVVTSLLPIPYPSNLSALFRLDPSFVSTIQYYQDIQILETVNVHSFSCESFTISVAFEIQKIVLYLPGQLIRFAVKLLTEFFDFVFFGQKCQNNHRIKVGSAGVHNFLYCSIMRHGPFIGPL